MNATDLLANTLSSGISFFYILYLYSSYTHRVDIRHQYASGCHTETRGCVKGKLRESQLFSSFSCNLRTHGHLQPEYMLMLSSVLVNETSPLHVRNAAGLALKNALSARVRLSLSTTHLQHSLTLTITITFNFRRKSSLNTYA